MTLRRFIFRSLLHYWSTNLATVAGLAVATAVIAGSLMVGDSMNASLRRMALARIGSIDYALASRGFFRAAMARNLSASAKQISASILTSGVARVADADIGSVRVNVCGVDDGFWSMYPGSLPSPVADRTVAINRSLASELGIKAGDEILLTLPRPSLIPGASLFARRKSEQTMRAIRVQIGAILPQQGAGGFDLEPASSSPRNVFIARDFLAKSIEKPGLANLLLVDTRGQADRHILQSAFDRSCNLADYGLRLIESETSPIVALESDSILLTSGQIAAVQRAAAATGADAAVSSVYLATRIAVAGATNRSTSYCIVAAVDPAPPFTFVAGGGKGPADGEIWINDWAARDLGATLGQKLELSILAAQADGTYREIPMPLALRGIVALSGPAADQSLTPGLAGMTDAQRIDRWDVPFPVDLKRVSDRDEQYWDHHRATPKAFVSMNTMRTIWARASALDPPFVTSVRISPAPVNLEAAILRELPAAEAPGAFEDVRARLLDASQTNTDFGSLLLAMGFFLIAAAVGLAGTLMRLSMSRRASELGIMLACGFSRRKAGFTFFIEGSLLAALGAGLGLPLGAGYCRLVLWGLTREASSLWEGPSLELSITGPTLATAWLAGWAVGLLCCAWSIRALRGRPVLTLLSGWQRHERPEVLGPLVRVVLTCMLVAGVALPTISLAGAGVSATVAFFTGGACLLVAGLTAVRGMLSLGFPTAARRMSLASLAIRNASASRTRSLLVAGLLASASFILVAVAANRRDVPESIRHNRGGGSGGFAWRVTTTLPLHFDVSTPIGRRNLGFSESDESVMADTTIVPFLVVAGDDISCRNLGRAARPTLLGASRAMIDRAGFSVRLASGWRDSNPWNALLSEQPDGSIPVFGDADSIQWILHSGPGQVLSYPGPANKPLRLRIVGTITGSIFASELIMSEQHLRQFYGESATPSDFLVDAPRDGDSRIASVLRRTLDDYGVDVQSTQQIIAGFVAVQNLYLSMFLMLGGLGLLLGAAGILAVILRNVLERRRELALMLACGFSRTRLLTLIAMEHAGLLLAGLACGAAAAILAVAPALVASESDVPWTALAALLAGTALVGMIGCFAGAAAAVRRHLLAALRQE